MRAISRRFGPTVALDGVDIVVPQGEIVAVVGENGAGKSTLMRVLAGADRPDSGEMRLRGVPYAPRSPAQARALGVMMIYQELSLAPHLSVWENIVLGAEPMRAGLVDRARARRIAGQALARLGHAELDPDTLVRSLTMGMRQIVEIARAIAADAKIIVFDEPTSSLTDSDARRLLGLIQSLRGEGRSMIYISHALSEVRTVADRVVVLRDGRSVACGAASELTTDEIIRHMVGRQVEDLYRRPTRTRTTGERVLEIDGLFGLRAPHGASLQLHRGEVVGIAGLIGAGRTELLRCIFGLDPVRRGSVRVLHFHGRPDPEVLWKNGAGFVSEDRKSEGLALRRSIAENICLPRLPAGRWRGWISPGSLDRSAATWMTRLGVRSTSPRQPVGALSGGNQQKVALARLLHARADVLLLDEPTRGIDVGAKAEIYRLIDLYATGDAQLGEAPRAVLLVSSSLPELLGLCDRIAVMSRGRLGPARPVEELTEESVMREATGERS